MLAQAAGYEAAAGFPVFHEGTVRVLAAAIARDDFLEENLLGPDLARGANEEVAQFPRRVNAPRLGPGGVEEILLDRGFEGERQAAVERGKIFGRARIERLRAGDAESPGEFIGVLLVAGPFRSLPLGGRDPEIRRQFRAVSGDGRDRFVAGGEEHPVPETQPVADVEQSVDRLPFVEQVFHANGAADVAGERRDRVLIVGDNDGDAAAAEAARHAEAGMVAADDESAGLVSERGHGVVHFLFFGMTFAGERVAESRRSAAGRFGHMSSPLPRFARRGSGSRRAAGAAPVTEASPSGGRGLRETRPKRCVTGRGAVPETLPPARSATLVHRGIRGARVRARPG